MKRKDQFPVCNPTATFGVMVGPFVVISGTLDDPAGCYAPVCTGMTGIGQFCHIRGGGYPGFQILVPRPVLLDAGPVGRFAPGYDRL